VDACRFGKVRGKRLHPIIKGTGIDHHATLSEPLRYLGVAQAVVLPLLVVDNSASR
jgi:hypothetical protein